MLCHTYICNIYYVYVMMYCVIGTLNYIVNFKIQMSSYIACMLATGLKNTSE